MKGYQITFSTQRSRQHRGKPIGDWLIQLADELGLRDATLIPAANKEGGQDRHPSTTPSFELAGQPLSIVMTATSEETDRLFERLRVEGVQLYYVKAAVELEDRRPKSPRLTLVR